MKKASSDKVFIPDYAIVKVKQMEHIVAVRHKKKHGISERIFF